MCSILLILVGTCYTTTELHAWKCYFHISYHLIYCHTQYFGDWLTDNLLKLQLKRDWRLTCPVVLTPFWWMLHFPTFLWKSRQHVIASVLFSQEHPWLKVLTHCLGPLWCPPLIMALCLNWCSVSKRNNTSRKNKKAAMGVTGVSEGISIPTFMHYWTFMYRKKSWNISYFAVFLADYHHKCQSFFFTNTKLS